MNARTELEVPPSSTQKSRGHSAASSLLALLLVNAMWAFQFSGAKIVTERLGPISTALIPLVLSTMLFAPLLAVRSRRSTHRFSSRLLMELFAIATLGILPAQLGLTWGVEHSLASNAAVITLTIPVLTAIMASILLGEKMTSLRWLSFVLAILGVVIVSKVDLSSTDLFRSGYLVGNLLILASCLGSVYNNTYSKKLLAVLNPLELLVYSFLIADIELFFLMLLFERTAFARLGSLEMNIWVSLLSIAIFSLSISMMLYFWVIQRIDVMQASLSIYLLPVFGVLFSALLLHERITTELLAGGVLVFAATFLIVVQEERQARSPKKSDAEAS